MKNKLLLAFGLTLFSVLLNGQSCDGYIKSRDSVYTFKTFSITGSNDVINYGFNFAYPTLSRVDQNGNFIWIKKICNSTTMLNDVESSGTAIYCIVDTSANNITDSYLRKYSLNGNLLSEVALPVNMACYDFQVDVFNTIVVIGVISTSITIGSTTLAPNTQTASGIHEEDVLIKYDQNLTVLWSKFAFTWSNNSTTYYNYNSINIDKSNGDIFFMNSGAGSSPATFNFGNSAIAASTSGSLVLAKFDANGTTQWANSGSPSPPVLDNWAIINGKVYIGMPPLPSNLIPAKLEIFSSASGSILASYTRSINTAYYPRFLFDASSVYCVGADPTTNANFVEKYDHTFSVIKRCYFGNIPYSSFFTGNLTNNYFYFCMSNVKNVFYAPSFYKATIAPNDSTSFYGKIGSDLNMLSGNFISGTQSLVCGQNYQIDLTSGIPDPFTQNYNGLSISWSPTTGIISSGQFSVNLSPGNTTQYVASIGDNTCSVNDTLNVIVNTISSFNYTVNGMVANFSKQNTLCNSFLWDFGNGNTSSINPDPIITYANPGTYGVCLQCNGSSNCTKCLAITVPGNSIGGVGIKEVEEDILFSIYPNPSDGKIYLEMSNGMTFNHQLVVTDILGNVVENIMLRNTIEELDLSKEPSGCYFLSFYDQNGKQKIMKVLLN